MKQLWLPTALLACTIVSCQADNRYFIKKEIQIKTAVLPLADSEMENATVYGYDETGDFVVLRQGTGNMICLADDPAKEGISVSCYSRKLEPFMARGRELTAEGKTQEERVAIREEEADSGKLEMPKEPSMMYVYFGKDENYDKTTGELKDGSFRYVVYIPYATTESTGLPDKPHAPGMPWLMDPGTHRAHIMIGPN